LSKMSKKSDMEAMSEASHELEQQAQEIIQNRRLAGMVVHLWLETYGFELLEKEIDKK
jgi:predicted transcriptional regulator